MSQTLITCEYCNREWDGNAQCPCGINLTGDYDYECLSLSDSDRKDDIKTPEVKKIIKTTKDVSIQTEQTPLELGQAAVNEMFIKKYNLR